MTLKTSSSADLKENKSYKRYKNAGFFVRQKELARRRLWPIALTFLSYLIYNVVCTATVLSGALEEAALNHYSLIDKTKTLTEALTGLLGKNNISWALLALPLSAMLAIEGFAWMDSRREVDFFESLPVPRRQRFWDICIAGFLYYIFSYIITLEIGLLIANGYGVLTHVILIEIIKTAVKIIAFFLSCYALAVLSVMLTGNVIVACLAFGVLLVYEMLFRAVLQGYCAEFFATWSGSPSPFLEKSIFSPLVHYFHDGGVLEATLRLLALAVLFFLLARICLHLRRNERAGSAVIFHPVQSVVRVALALLVGLSTGLLVASVRTGRGILISVIWMLLFTVITACIMQIIYEYDFRSLFHRPLEIASAVALSLLLYMGFVFDITGYDRFIPDPDKVADAAIVCSNSAYNYSTDEGRYVSSNDYGRKYMHLKNVEDVIAIASYGQEFTRDMKHSPGQSTADSDTGVDVTDENSVPRPHEIFDFLLVYNMKNGNTITRRISLPSTVDPSMMNAVVETEEFREGTFNIYHDNTVRAEADGATLECTNGKDYYSRKLTAEEYEAFRKAYIADLATFSYSFARENVPVARVSFTTNKPHEDEDGAIYEESVVTCPVYPSFENTIRVLKDQTVWPEPLDYITLLRGSYDYNLLAPKAKEVYDETDMSIFSGPFNNSTIYGYTNY